METTGGYRDDGDKDVGYIPDDCNGGVSDGHAPDSSQMTPNYTTICKHSDKPQIKPTPNREPSKQTPVLVPEPSLFRS